MKTVWKKLKKEIRYPYLLLWHLLLYLPARILKKVHPHYRELWLVSERGHDARDNGYWMYRYLRVQHHEINACYVIERDCPDHIRVASLGPTVSFGSLRHHLKYLAADVLIGTHVQPAAPGQWEYFRMMSLGIRAPGKQIFLGHGITKDNVSYLHYPKLRVDLFVCGAKPEYNYVSAHYGHPEGTTAYLGLPRYDGLAAASSASREVLVMPTWRSSAYPQGDAFPQTAFYRYYQEFLNASELTELLERLDLRLIFYPHTELQKELHHFSPPSERIILADQEHYDVQDLLKRCCLLITDYSSVYFDAAYMRKPVIYYQFDREDYRKRLYAEGYFSYDRDGFGPVVTTCDDLMKELIICAESGFEQQPLYRERAERFFPLRDDHNCERTYQVIMNLVRRTDK